MIGKTFRPRRIGSEHFREVGVLATVRDSGNERLKIALIRCDRGLSVAAKHVGVTLIGRRCVDKIDQIGLQDRCSQARPDQKASGYP